MEQVKMLLLERSKSSMEIARQAILQEQFKYQPLGEALRYFMTEIWYNASHPALLSLTCEAVGGDPKATEEIGAAFVLLAGAADIHDDIIDQSLTKEDKPTVFGKYGQDMAIISGNVLWFRGMLQLAEACDKFPRANKEAILKYAKEAFFDIGSAEAKEASLRRNIDLEPENYLDIIKMKISVAEAAAKIGVIAGNGTAEQIECLGQYGKTLGTLMTIRDEFVDMYDLEEVRNRFKNECLPLPILYAFQDKALKKEILSIIQKEVFSESELEKIVELVVNSRPVNKLVDSMHAEVTNANMDLRAIKKKDIELKQLLSSTLIDLST